MVKMIEDVDTSTNVRFVAVFQTEKTKIERTS